MNSMTQRKVIFWSMPFLSGLFYASGWFSGIPVVFVFFALIPILWLEDQTQNQKSKLSSSSYYLYVFAAFSFANLLCFWWSFKVSFFSFIATVILNAMVYSLPFILHHKFKLFSKSKSYLSLVIFTLGVEFLHSRWELAFPWLNLGNALSKTPGLISWYDVTGVSGGSLWILSVNILMYISLKRLRMHKKAYAYLIATSLIIIIPAIIAKNHKYDQEICNSLRISIIQPNINPYTEKFDLESIPQQTEKIIKIAKDSDIADVYIAPETAIAEEIWMDSIQNNSNVLKILNFLKDKDSSLFICGMYLRKKTNVPDVNPMDLRVYEDSIYYRLYNAAAVFDKKGLKDVYFKSKLVPGTEKAPFAKYFGFLKKMDISIGGPSGTLGSDQKSKALIIKGLNFKTLICWEGIFSEFAVRENEAQASSLLILTNDGWWSHPQGYRAHLKFARLRAIESGKYLIRAANTGISAIISPSGEILEKSPINQKALIQSDVFFCKNQSYYSRHGDFLGRISLFLSCLFVLFILSNYFRKRNKQD